MSEVGSPETLSGLDLSSGELTPPQLSALEGFIHLAHSSVLPETVQRGMELYDKGDLAGEAITSYLSEDPNHRRVVDTWSAVCLTKAVFVGFDEKIEEELDSDRNHWELLRQRLPSNRAPSYQQERELWQKAVCRSRFLFLYRNMYNRFSVQQPNESVA